MGVQLIIEGKTAYQITSNGDITDIQPWYKKHYKCRDCKGKGCVKCLNTGIKFSHRV